MSSRKYLLLLILIGKLLLMASGCANLSLTSQQIYNKASLADWQQVMFDSGKTDWQDKWLLDGLHANITHTEDGMAFRAGPEFNNHAHHAVLWTKQSFEGDIKIEYNYTKLDSTVKAVTILYVYAQGKGGEYPSDISLWADKRQKPFMKYYFNNMKAYHISYAAYRLANLKEGNDYIRARRYMPELKKGLTGTEFKPDYLHTNLFATGVKHKMTVLIKGDNFFMHIKNNKKQLLIHWNRSDFPILNKGRVGLRHMFTRGALYSDIKISTL